MGKAPVPQVVLIRNPEFKSQHIGIGQNSADIPNNQKRIGCSLNHTTLPKPTAARAFLKAEAILLLLILETKKSNKREIRCH